MLLEISLHLSQTLTGDVKTKYRIWEMSLVHCLRYFYSCFALVTILGNELVIFPGIMFYYGNNCILLMK